MLAATHRKTAAESLHTIPYPISTPPHILHQCNLGYFKSNSLLKLNYSLEETLMYPQTNGRWTSGAEKMKYIFKSKVLK